MESGWISATFPDALYRQHADQGRKREERGQHENHQK